MAVPEPYVFISYTQSDSEWVANLATDLHRLRVRTFLRERDIEAGQIDLHEIEKALGAADTAILVLSGAMVADPQTYEEYAAVLTEAGRRGLRLLPVLYGPASIPAPPFASTRLWADFRGLGGARYEARVAALAGILRDPGHSAAALGSEVPEQPRSAQPSPDLPAPEPRFVVTYARPDAGYGVRLVDWLTASGLPAWSIADLSWGSRWVREIRQRLRNALAVVVIMSRYAEESEDVEREILEGQWHGREFFPILLHGDRNFLLASSWYFDARGNALPGEPELRRLHRIYRAHLSGRPVTPPEPVRLPDRAPMPGIPHGVPLRRLRAFLREGELAHADLLTTSLVLGEAHRLDAGWMDKRDLRDLPGSLLSDLDACWAEETAGRHGFRRQLDLYRLQGSQGRDFLDLASAYGWRAAAGTAPGYGERNVSGKYHEFIDRSPVPAGFFPTLRNQQVETYPAWYDRWRSTVIAVHLRLQSWDR